MRKHSKMMRVLLLNTMTALGCAPDTTTTGQAIAAQAVATNAPTTNMVRFSIPFAPEGHLSDEEVGLQRKRIQQAQEEIEPLLQGTNCFITRKYQTLPGLAASLTQECIDKISKHPLVAEVKEDRLQTISLTESTEIVQAKQARSYGYTGNGWMVAVIDTGVDVNHPFFAGRIAAEACFSGSGHCPNGRSTQVGRGASQFCSLDAARCAHGTHVAGIAMGLATDRSGVAPGATLFSVSVYSRFTGDICTRNKLKDPCMLISGSDITAALEHVFLERTHFRMAAVNLSLGGSTPYAIPCDAEDPLYAAAVDNLQSADIPVIASSGNESFTTGISLPACFRNAIAVGATTKPDNIASFSNAPVQLLAPGVDIVSSVPGGGFASMSGTSMATPHVSGAFAILKAAFPTMDSQTLYNRLYNTGLKITDTRTGQEYRRIQVLPVLDMDRKPDLVSIKKSYTASGGSGNHQIYASSSATSFATQLPMKTFYYPGVDENWRFFFRDWNADGYADVIGIQKSVSAAVPTQVVIFNGRFGYTLERMMPTGLTKTDKNWDFDFVDWNHDGYQDLVGIFQSGTGTGTTEVHILSGKDSYRTFLVRTGTALHETDANFAFALADWNRDGYFDLFAIPRAGTSSHTTEVHVFSGRDLFRTGLVHSATSLRETDANWSFVVNDYNRDGILDLVALTRRATDSHSTELHIYSGADSFGTALLHTRSSMSELDARDDADFVMVQ